jgi:hypothetical protein
MIHISVDFNTMTMDPHERVLIPTHVETDLLHHLRSGQEVVLYDESLEVEAVVEFDPADRRWWAQPNWASKRHLSEVVTSGRRDD